MKKLMIIIILFTSCATVKPTYDNQIPFPMSAQPAPTKSLEISELSQEAIEKQERDTTINALIIGGFFGLVIMFFANLYDDYVK